MTTTGDRNGHRHPQTLAILEKSALPAPWVGMGYLVEEWSDEEGSGPVKRPGESHEAVQEPSGRERTKASERMQTNAMDHSVPESDRRPRIRLLSLNDGKVSLAFSPLPIVRASKAAANRGRRRGRAWRAFSGDGGRDRTWTEIILNFICQECFNDVLFLLVELSKTETLSIGFSKRRSLARDLTRFSILYMDEETLLACFFIK
ncbi:hypothetical protein EVAR_17015_1 [Eumeta japonica]|uniref:Uncharacterized protein n=1 Tax=Eumeta variegata TaxID=151549 RepID=A0A4C1TVY0_EUMVA|nr:hypothetical protein EVAR_17015_1 [Eumeta japonica]